MRNLNLLAVAALVVAGCGPSGPGSLEGFGDGDFGETEGPGDGDPGPGDGDPGPGDGDPVPSECVDAEFGDAPEIYFQDLLSEDASSDHIGACLPAPGPDYSIAWTAPASGPYRAILYADFFGELAILRGGCDGATLDCAVEDIPQIIDFQASAGQDYTFVVDSAEGFGGYFEFSLFPVGGMGECPEGELIGPADSVSGSTVGASNTFGSPCGGEAAPDHGYIFVPPVTGTYHVDMFGSNYDTMLHVFEGECGGALIDCNDDSFELQSELYVFLEAGMVYTIVADGFGGDAGSYQLNVELIDQPPPPQLCDGAEDLGDTVPLLIEWPSDFDLGDLYMNCSPAPAELRLRWTAPADGIYRVVQDAQPNFSALSVIEDGCFGEIGPCIPADDQGAIHEFEAFAGQELLFISEWQPFPQTTVSLSLTEVTPAGPGCGQAIMGDFVSGNTLNGGDQYDGSCSSGPAPEDEYWWTAPATGAYLISLEGSNYDTLMYVRDGGCNGPELACNDDTFTDQGVSLWSSVELDLSVGQTISIFVDGYNGSGTYDLTISPI